MKCPYCGEIDSKVIDSRPADDGERIRRRRECLVCQKRFTTYEIVETVPLMAVSYTHLDVYKRQFYVLYANIDAFDATKYALEYDKLSVMDKWILSKMNSMSETAFTPQVLGAHSQILRVEKPLSCVDHDGFVPLSLSLIHI